MNWKTACLFLWIVARGAHAQVNITTWQVDPQHTGRNAQETILTPAQVSAPGGFGLLFSQPLDGQSYSQPLYVSALDIGGTPRNVVYVTTQHDSVYAFDADSDVGANATPIWQRSLLPPGTTPVPYSDTLTGDISPELGITATPVIDLASRTLYTISKYKVTANSTCQQWLHALDLKTGADKPGSPVLINPTFAGSAPEGAGGVVPFNPLREHARAALALYNGIVYVTYASHGDAQPYHGEILGYDAATLQLVKTFNTTPNANGSGIWQGGASPAFDSAGNMYVVTGNGPFDQNSSPYTTATDWGEAMLKLPTTGSFAVAYSNPLNWFVPNNYANLNFGDLDLGSSGIMLLPDQPGPHPHLLLGGGKGGTLYVVDRDSMGGLHTPNNSVQEIEETTGLFVTPAYHNGSIYYTPAFGHLTQRSVAYDSLTGNYLSTTAKKSNFTYDAGGLGSWIFISSNGNSNGIVWTIRRSTPAELHAYNAADVSGDPIYTGTASLPGSIDCAGMKFGYPMVANGRVYFTTYDTKNNLNTGHLMVYGVPPPAVGLPNAPSAVAVTPISSSKIVISWNDNSTNELGFTIKRSDRVDGTFVALAPGTNANVTSFVDTTADPSATYYYEVVAFNANGNSAASSIVPGTSFPLYVPQDLVAAWDFDESSGAVARDVTGHGFNGAIQGEAGRSPGFFNNAADFHGTGAVASRVVVPDAPEMRFVAAESFTLSAWIKPSGLRSSDEAVFTKSRNAGNYYGLWINAANHWAFRGPGGDVVGPAAVADSWTHVAIVQDGNAGTRSIYVNGVLGGTGPAQSANGSGDFWMGQASAPVSGAAIDSFPGLVDDVRLYRRAFDADSISLLPGPPVLQAESSQTHTGQGAHKCVIWPAKFPGIEARKGNVVGQYKIVLHFPVAVSGIAASLGLQGGGSAVGSVSSVAYDSTNKIVTVTLTGVANLQALNLHLSGIAPGNGTADIPFDIIWGDVDRDHLVSNIDLAGVVRKHANFVNDDNALCDLNGDGNVNSSDDAIVTANLGNHIGRQTDTNLSVGGIASSSSNENATNVPDGAVDGIWFTRWASLWSDPQWISVDLGETFSIHSVSLEWQNAAGATYLIQVSADNSNWTTVWTEAANNGPGIKTYTGANVQGRYVRMYGTTRTTPFGYSIWDFRINGIYPAAISAPSVTSPSTLSGTVGTSVSYQIAATNTPTSFSADNLPPGLSIDTITGVISGTPTAAATTTATLHATNDGGTGNFSLSCEIAGPPPDANLAISKSAAASSSQATTPPSAATDGDPATRWAASAATWPQSWTVDLGAVRTLSKTDIKWYSGATRAYKYRVEVSTDGAIYSPVVDKTANRTFGNNPDLFTATARYVRVTATGCSAGGAIASANEIFVFGH